MHHNTPPINTHPALGGLLNDLQNHALLTNAGLDSEQASEVVFNRLKVTNENDQMQMRQASELSECCMSAVGYSGLHTYCMECGESCMVVYPS